MKLFFFITLLLICYSCINTDAVKRPSAPKDLIPKEKMENIMYELGKLETMAEKQYGTVDKYYDILLKSGDSVLSSFDVTREQYLNSIRYYSVYQKEMIGMQNELLERLNRDLGELRKNK